MEKDINDEAQEESKKNEHLEEKDSKNNEEKFFHILFKYNQFPLAF